MAKTKAPPQSELASTLAEFLCFAVYSTNLAFKRAYKPLLDKFGLTYLQYAILMALAAKDDQTVTGLGNRLFLDSSTMTPLLKRMEQMGLVRRQRDTEDERQIRISITDKGRRERQEVFCKRTLIIEATGLTCDGFVRMQADLVKLRDNLSRNSRM